MPFAYYMPVRIVAGEDCIKKNAALLAPFGARALVVTGKSSAKKRRARRHRLRPRQERADVRRLRQDRAQPLRRERQRGRRAGALVRGGLYRRGGRRLAHGRGQGGRPVRAAGGRRHLHPSHRGRRAPHGAHPDDGGHGQRGHALFYPHPTTRGRPSAASPRRSCSPSSHFWTESTWPISRSR